MTHIVIKAVSQYGNVRNYVDDPALAETIEALTGTRTLTDHQIHALVLLGHTVSVQEALRRPERGS